MKTVWKKKVIALQALGMSLTGIARDVGLSPQSISDIKHGRTSEPSGMAAVRLHKLYAKHSRRPSTAAKRAAGVIDKSTANHKTP